MDSVSEACQGHHILRKQVLHMDDKARPNEKRRTPTTRPIGSGGVKVSTTSGGSSNKALRARVDGAGDRTRPL